MLAPVWFWEPQSSARVVGAPCLSVSHLCRPEVLFNKTHQQVSYLTNIHLIWLISFECFNSIS